MTEAEWLASTDGIPMFDHLRSKTSNRKLRLYFVAYLRTVSHLLPNDYCRRMVGISELYADNLATLADVDAARIHVLDWGYLIERQDFEGVVRAREVADITNRILPWPHSGSPGLIRDIFGNPFRPATLDPAWLTPNVVALANGIYDDRAFDRLPILADALEEAGCEDEEMLLHCRRPGEHVRGCWVVDLLTGRK